MRTNRTYNTITIIEINEIDTVVSIDFTHDGIGIEITKITNLDSGNAISPDLTGEMNEIGEIALYNELHEFAHNMEADKRSNGFSFSY